MIKYIIGWFKNLFNPAVSIFALIDKNSAVSKKAKIYRGSKVLNSKIDSYSYLTTGSSSVYAEIGKFCSIGHGSIIGLANHTLNMLSTSPLFTEKNNATSHQWIQSSRENPYKKVVIGNDVWIGSRVMVLGGINIADGAVVAAGSIVTRDIPPYAIVAGVPARVVKYRFENDFIEKLLEVQWWSFTDKYIKEQIEIFNKSNLTTTDLERAFNLIDKIKSNG